MKYLMDLGIPGTPGLSFSLADGDAALSRCGSSSLASALRGACWVEFQFGTSNGLSKKSRIYICIYIIFIYICIHLQAHTHTYMHVHIYIYIYICIFLYTHTHTNIYINIYIVSVCVCVCMYRRHLSRFGTLIQCS